MDVPEFCVRASARLARKRKTEEEIDPDFEPVPSCSRPAKVSTVAKPKVSKAKASKVKAIAATPTPTPKVAEVKKVRRSTVLARDRRQMNKFRLNVESSYEQFEKYQADDRKSKQQPQVQIKEEKLDGVVNDDGTLRSTLVNLANNLNEVDGEVLDSYDLPFRSFQEYQSSNPFEQHGEDEGGDNVDHNEGFMDINNLPKYAMGTGGPPVSEFRTLYRYDLPPMDLEEEDEEETMRRKYPWKVDVTMPDVNPEILSIVGCFTVGSQLDLKEIAGNSRNVEYNPQRFAPLIMRIREPKCTALIFRTGRIIVTGAKSEGQCKKAARKYARVLQRQGYKVKVLNLTVQNISAGCKLKFRVRLNALGTDKMFGATRVSYEPELFPGLVISLDYPHVKVIVFCTGSVLMTGAKSEKDVQTALRIVYPLLRIYAY